MKSIQTKFVALILGCVFVCTFVIGGAGVLQAQKVIDKESEQNMNLLCEDNAKDVDFQLSRIKQSVDMVYSYAREHLGDTEQMKQNGESLEAYSEKVRNIAVNLAENTNGAIAVYLRYNPDEYPATSGFFWGKDESSNRFSKLSPTDFSKYDKDDIERVGWYYIPVNERKATWMEPYLNQNLGVHMISYVIPLIKDNEVIGVVGMDIDFNVITNRVKNIKCYDSGYGLLVDKDAKILYHETLPINASMRDLDDSLKPVIDELEMGSSEDSLFTYEWNGESKKMAFRSLINGMRLGLTAPEDEIDEARDDLISQIIWSAIVLSFLAVIITVLMARRIVQPLKELTVAAKKIADGDLSITIEQRTSDEIGVLADSFRQTVGHLQKYISYINSLAYRDSLTGMKNKTAYQETVEHLEEEMKLGRPTFAVAVLDINNLKNVNDTYGHDYGDILIHDTAMIISAAFKRSAMYRVGGDEFVVILQDSDYERYGERRDDMNRMIEEHNKDTLKGGEISVACGIAVYTPSTDIIYNDVFKRADSTMYENKAAMKKKGVQDDKKESGTGNN